MQPKILVVGGGVAGATLAYWLAKAGAKVLVVERYPAESNLGQGIDIEEPAREIIRRMGILEEVKRATTGEKGFAIVDGDNQVISWIPGGLTREIEIMRGDLTTILLKAAKSLESVDVQYGRTVTTLSQTASNVSVTFDNGQQQDFTAIVAADGLRSKTRELIFDHEALQGVIKPLDVFVSYFSIPRQKGDEGLARMQNAPGGRSLFVRPVDEQRSSGYLNVITKSPRLENALRQDQRAQKEALQEIFSDLGGQAPRIVDGMLSTDNFYFERISQVKMKRWSQGRGAALGDAAYAPSPLTGEGTKLAIVGAYIMAGELSKSFEDPSRAFQAYESKYRTYVEKSQTIPLAGYAPNLLNPQTSWGIYILHTIFRFVAWSGLWKLIGGQGSTEVPDVVDLPSWIPEYPLLYK